MQVTQLYVYPLKGGAPISLERAHLDSFGIEHDRRWMVIDETGSFLTQREHPRIGRIRVTIDEPDLVLESDTAGSVRVPLRPGGYVGRERVVIWRDVVTAWDAGDAAAAFLQDHLDARVRLVFMPDSTHRQADLEFASVGDRVSFVDGFPLLLITQASLDALNDRLDDAVPMLRFRPNIVVTGAAPHEEDSWRRIVVGDIACDVVKPCARCVVTTIDLDTSIPGREPLRTLSQYRQRNNKVYFGQNVIHRGVGSFAVGDTVEVLTTGVPRPPIGLSQAS